MGWREGCFPKGLRVLVVDNDPACYGSLERRLTKWKCHVRICTLAVDAVNCIEQGKDEFDVVIAEMKLPDMDGFQFVAHVRLLKTDLPVILMCGEELEDDYSMLEKGAITFASR